MTTPEYRYSGGIRLEGRTLVGIVMPYGKVSPVFRERFRPGAFGDLAQVDVILNSMHQRPQPLARTGGGLVLTDSAEELSMAASLPNTRLADDTIELVRERVLRGLSVEFHSLEEHNEGGIRVITRAKLAGIGVVDQPAYDEAVVEARSTAKRRRKLWL